MSFGAPQPEIGEGGHTDHYEESGAFKPPSCFLQTNSNSVITIYDFGESTCLDGSVGHAVTCFDCPISSGKNYFQSSTHWNLCSLAKYFHRFIRD